MNLDIFLNQLLVLLGFVSLVLIPFLILLIKDIRKLTHQIEDAMSDGKLENHEIDEILNTVGGIFLKIYNFFAMRQK